MTLSDLAVRRPVLAAVGAIILCVLGLAAFFSLPVRELPSVDPPQVSVETSYRGASAEVIEERITQVIEQQVAGIQGIDRVTSSSRDGQSRINIAFTLDRNLDEAANDVRDAVSRVVSRLPEQADPPQIAKANADSSPIIFLSLVSTSLTPIQLSDYASRYLVERLSTIPGVATVGLRGAPTYAMRLWLNADAMAARGITVDDVEAALNTQNIELPAGALESKAKDYTIRVNRQYGKAVDFAALPVGKVAAQSGYVTRLGDIARIEEGADERRKLFRKNGFNQVGLALTRQSQANDLAIAQAVKAELKEINPTLPKDTRIEITADYTTFTSEAIHEVWVTMALSLVLVAGVNILFLGSWRAAIIPSIVAPICVLATFLVLAPLGFSLNLLTLLALVLAIGLVVDDAIVVVENIQRRIDEGEPPLLAAERGARQVFFAVVATTVVLIAVFAPLMFLPGYIGRLFVELAVAIASAVAFSAILALSLSPMLASKLLRPASGLGPVARAVDASVAAVSASYQASLRALLGRGSVTAGVGVLVLLFGLAAGGLFLALPQELVPKEDRGRVDFNVQTPEGSGFDYTRQIALKVEPVLEKLRRSGVVDRYFLSVPGFGGGGNAFNSGSGGVILKDWRDRTVTANDVAADLNKALGKVTAARITATVRGPFQRGGGGGSGTNVDLVAKGNEYPEIAAWIAPILAAAQDNPGLVRPRLTYEPTSPRLLVNLDREKAAAMGVSIQAVGRTLETMFGSRKVTTYVKNGQEYDVIMQTELDQRRTLEDLNSLHVRTASGALVPLAAVVTAQVRGDTPSRDRTDRQRSITLTAELAPGYTVKQAIDFYRVQTTENPNPGIVVAWGGQAKDFLEGRGGVSFAFGMALLLVFLVLAAQFESWIHPAVIMLTVPLAVLGGLFGLLMAGSSINTYSQIGLIILVGIAAKNGILIVEFANQRRDEGRSVTEALIEAAGVRLRPIVMTAIATAFGALPLILARGPGAGSRTTIGVVIFAGAIFTTLLTLFVVPVFYNLLARFTRSPDATARQLEALEREMGESDLAR